MWKNWPASGVCCCCAADTRVLTNESSTSCEPDEISIGDFVLNGGEVAAMVVIDAVIRLVPGVLGDERSSGEDSFSGPERMLEFSQYTRPREYRGYEVPEILLSGDHGRKSPDGGEQRADSGGQRWQNPQPAAISGSSAAMKSQHQTSQHPPADNSRGRPAADEINLSRTK